MAKRWSEACEMGKSWLLLLVMMVKVMENHV